MVRIVKRRGRFCLIFMAGVSGLEPELAASKTDVLPLHYTPTGADDED